MVRLRGGTVQMGIEATQIPGLLKTFDIHAPQVFQDEVPKHSVTLDGFYFDKYLVTNAQFKSFTDANPEWQPDRIPREPHNGNYLKHWKEPIAFTTKADHPVVNVSWYAAVAYCRWASFVRAGAPGAPDSSAVCATVREAQQERLLRCGSDCRGGRTREHAFRAYQDG